MIIGAAGGFGSATAELLSESGWHVIATDNSQDFFNLYNGKANITPVSIDIASDVSVAEAFEQISALTGGLDTIIHMAGILKVGSVAELPLSELEEALNTNLSGAYRVNQQFLPLLLPVKWGDWLIRKMLS